MRSLNGLYTYSRAMKLKVLLIIRAVCLDGLCFIRADLFDTFCLPLPANIPGTMRAMAALVWRDITLDTEREIATPVPSPAPMACLEKYSRTTFCGLENYLIFNVRFQQKTFRKGFERLGECVSVHSASFWFFPASSSNIEF